MFNLQSRSTKPSAGTTRRRAANSSNLPPAGLDQKYSMREPLLITTVSLILISCIKYTSSFSVNCNISPRWTTIRRYHHHHYHRPERYNTIKTTLKISPNLDDFDFEPVKKSNDDGGDEDDTDLLEESEEMATNELEDESSSSSSSLKNSGIIIPDGGLGSPCIIKVIGVGGGGGNAVNRMIQTSIQGVSFWAINTDSQALARSLCTPNILNIGPQTTRGLGAGGIPDAGRRAALENADDLERICDGADLIFITAGMGGGTGSGAAPIVADIAKNRCGALTVGVVTKPFAFEGRQRMRQAEEAIERLREMVDTLIIVSNDKLLRIVPDNTPVMDAFLVADDILRQGVVGISEIIIKSGLVNVDFADVKSVMKDAGTALMGVGSGVGRMRAQDAAVAAISSPLLDFPIKKARGIVFNVVGGPDLALSEINAASEVIYENADPDANIIFGALVEEGMGKEVSITVLACDFRVDDDDEEEEEERKVDFYKERREMTKSPLGADATLEDTRTYITRGSVNAIDEGEVFGEKRDEKVKDEKKKGGVKGFFRRLTRRG